MMLLLLLLLLPTNSNGFLVRDTPVSYVIEPFESINKEWMIRDNDDSHSQNTFFKYSILNSSSTFGEEDDENEVGWLFGKGALQVEHIISNNDDAQQDNASTTFGWSLANRTHNCYGATEVSMWYKADLTTMTTANSGAAPTMKVSFLDDSFCMNSASSFDVPTGVSKHSFCQNFTDEVTIFEVDLDTTTTSDFQELRIDLSMLQGEHSIDLTRIRGWEIKIQGTTVGDKILFDQLACHGDGHLLGAAFHTDRTLEESIADGSWMESYYNSDLAKNRTTPTLQDGTLSIDYLLHKVETWGGFNDYSHLAPGAAYYNMSQATDLVFEYDILDIASKPGRAIFRVILQDNSHCTQDCDNDINNHERWYTFNSILDKEGPGTVAVPLIASTEPSAPFWIPGWSGIMGDEILSIEEIKGFTLELNLDSVLEIDDTVTGSLSVKNIAAAYTTDVIDSDVVYVMEPFERAFEQQESNHNNHTEITFSPNNDDDTTIFWNATLSSNEDAYIGNHALQVMFDVSSDPTSVASGRWILQDRPHNCYGAHYFSFWYKSLQPGVKLRMQLFDDSECIIADDDSSWSGKECAKINNLNRYEIYDDELTGDGEWHEVTSPTKAIIDGGLNLARIRGFMMTLLEGSGTLFVDQLACVGGGSMLDSAFHIDPTRTFRDAISESIWTEAYYNSNKSRDETVTSLQDGILSIDYTAEQRESWGGYLAYSHLAPGNAYYNLTQATDLSLSYNVKAVTSIPGRANFRFILEDSSDCTEDCDTDNNQLERWYSFNAVLDDPGRGQIFIPLIGSEEPSAPFFLPGWSGILGDRELSVEEIKGFTIELNLDSVLEIGDLVTGSVEFFDFEAVQTDEVEDGEHNSEYAPQCVEEKDLDFRLDYSKFKKTEFLGAQCCEVCEEDPECNYALIVARDCYTASYIESEYVGLIENNMARKGRTAMWMDDVSKRGNFCDRCVCRPDDLLIDCRDQDLVVIPKTFNETWAPRTVDLRANPRLTVLGTGSLEAIADSLQGILLPTNMKHVAPKSLSGLPQLLSIEFESGGEGDNAIANAISKPNEFFDHVCCNAGSVLELSGESSDASSLTFCNLVLHHPGIDSVYEPFINYDMATGLDLITPSSNFMAEAAESVEKCAEFCSINEECRFFGYDARVVNAEHLCYHWTERNTDGVRVCCADEHYADEEKLIPGWIAGRPPQTRHELDNARVIYSAKSLEVSKKKAFQTSYDVSLGSTPLRGAVWVKPELVTESTGLNVTIQPDRLVLYDKNQTATVTITVFGATPKVPSTSLIIRNQLESCDEAFTATRMSDENLVYVTVEIPDDETKWGLIFGLLVALLFLVCVGVFLFYEKKRKENDLVWQVKKEDLVFTEPPDIIGRGTFGLVLLAEYRGTQVAVKRVLPPRSKKRNSRGSDEGTRSGAGSSSEDSSGNPLEDYSKSGQFTRPGRSGAFESASNYKRTKAIGYGSPDANPSTSTFTRKNGIFSVFSGGNIRSSFGYGPPKSKWKRLRNEFREEIRVMSRLRHPCVTTVMGAVTGKYDEPMLVMEYMEHGSLYDILHNETMPIDGDLLLPILRDIAQGMRFLHSANPQILHGDLKAANILVDSKFRAKVADFGLSQKKNLGGTGTPYWMAPELLRCEGTNTSATDVYSFGITLYEVYSRRDPYDGEDPFEVLNMVADKNISKRPPVPENCPAQISSLMTDCIVDDADKRPTFEEADTRLKRIDAALIDANSSTKNTAISLFDIFPRHIAEALRDGKTVEPEHKDVVTIFFSDIIGFTSISADLPPAKIASMLDRLYTKLDELSQKHDVFKVETIGDAYMAVTNLVKDQQGDHCKRIANFAIDAVAAANGTLIDLDDPDKGYVNIRVGFHSGSIVADVVGTRNPRYCLFGDAVNTASRMESNSKANRIQCSSESASYLISQCPEIPLKSRGRIPIKGKEEMETFWVNYTPFGTCKNNSTKNMKTLWETGPENDDAEGMTVETFGSGSGSGNGAKEDLEAQLDDYEVPMSTS